MHQPLDVMYILTNKTGIAMHLMLLPEFTPNLIYTQRCVLKCVFNVDG